MSHSIFDSLPREVLCEIFTYFDVKALSRCSQVCTQWLQLTEPFWRTVCHTKGIYQDNTHSWRQLWIKSASLSEEIASKKLDSQISIEGIVTCLSVFQNKIYFAEESGKIGCIPDPKNSDTRLFFLHHQTLVKVLHVNEKRMISASDDEMVIWNLALRTPGKIWKHHQKELSLIKCDGVRLFCGCEDGKIVIWEVETGNRLKEVTFEGGRLTSLACYDHFLFCAGELVEGSRYARIAYWDLDSTRVAEKPFILVPTHKSSITFLLVDNDKLYSVGEDHLICVWNLRNKRPLHQFMCASEDREITALFLWREDVLLVATIYEKKSADISTVDDAEYGEALEQWYSQAELSFYFLGKNDTHITFEMPKEIFEINACIHNDEPSFLLRDGRDVCRLFFLSDFQKRRKISSDGALNPDCVKNFS